jgi:hypothetical protein
MKSQKLTFKELAKKVLEEEGKPLSAREIWKKAVEKGYDKLLESKGKTPWHTLGAQLYTDSKNENSEFTRVGEKPVRFFLKQPHTQLYTLNKQKTKTTKKYYEEDLHQVLTYYLRQKFKIYTKTIKHQKSRKKNQKSGKKNYTQWLHPDMVGVYFFKEDWIDELADFAKEIGFPSIALFSYELKKELNSSNLREAFFQAVSNSSWANEGYLVTAKIDPDILDELKRLSSSFGIGVILLNLEEPDNSQVVFQARKKEELDWDTMNKLASENPDFSDFLKRVRIDLSTGEPRTEKYDKVLTKLELLKKFNYDS